MKKLALAAILSFAAPAANAACSGSGTCVLLDNGTVAPMQVLGGVNAATALLGQAMSGINVSGVPQFTAIHRGAAVNAIAFGANPNTAGASAADQSSAINSAFNRNLLGSSAASNVYLPTGTYHVKNQITVPPGQCLIGDGYQNTIIDVDMDFSNSASGVIVISPTSPVLANNKPCVHGLQIYFHITPDITATASSVGGGSSTIVVSGATGTITNGMFVYDATTTNAIPFKGASNFNATTVSSISGGTITISPVTNASVNNGDVIHFASTRAGMSALGTCSTAIPGGSACQYPWAIYDNGANYLDLDDVMIVGAYNGIYSRGCVDFKKVYVGALNIGWDIDQCFNFAPVEFYGFWSYGFSPSNWPSTAAFATNFYDGATIAANLGEADGIAISKLSVWTGIVNVKSGFSFGHISSWMQDGGNADVAMTACQWLQVGEFYSTKGPTSSGVPLSMSASACRVTIDDVRLQTNVPTNTIQVSAGALAINGGSIKWNNTANSPPNFVSQTSGAFEMQNVHIDNAGIGTGATFLNQTGGVLKFQDNYFFSNPNAGGSTALSLTDNALNVVSGNQFNNWAFSAPGALGQYGFYEESGTITNSAGANLYLINPSLGTDLKSWEVSDTNTGNWAVKACSDSLLICNNAIAAIRGATDTVASINAYAAFLETGTTAPTLTTSEAGVWASAANGGVFAGYGSSYDLTLANNAGSAALQIPHGANYVVGNVLGTSATTVAAISDLVARIYYVDDFGAAGSAAGTAPSVDATSAINTALSTISGQGGGRVFLNPTKAYLVNSGNLTIPANTTLECPGPQVRYDPTSGQNNHTAHGCGIYVNPTYTINNSGALRNVYVVASNLTYPTTFRAAMTAAAAFAGTGVTLANVDARMQDVMVLGFATCISVNGFYHPQVQNVLMDCTNGYSANAVHDLSRNAHIEAFPFITYPSAQYSDAPYYQLTVTGAADNALGSHLYRLTVPTTNLVTGDTVFVSAIGGATGANGLWTVTVIDSTHVDLQGSATTPTPTVTTTNGSLFVTVSSTANLAIGQVITSANIPGGATVTAVWPQSSAISISAAATSTAGPTSASFANGSYTSGGQVGVSPSYRSGIGFQVTNSEGFQCYNCFVFFYNQGFVIGTGAKDFICETCIVDAPDYLTGEAALTAITFSGSGNYGNAWHGGYITSVAWAVVATSAASQPQVPNYVEDAEIHTVGTNIVEQTKSALVLSRFHVVSGSTGQALFNDSNSNSWLDLDADNWPSNSLYTSSGGYSKVRQSSNTVISGNPEIGNPYFNSVTSGLSVVAGTTTADYRWYNSGNSTDQKFTSCYEDSSGNFKCRFANDAFNASNIFLQATRGSGYTIGSVSIGGELITTASASGTAGFNLPNGSAPSSPVAGDVWTTSAVGGLFFRTNSVNYQAAVVNGVNTFTSGLAIDGTTPTSCSSTGSGSGASCAFSSNSNPTVGKILITAGSTASSSGTFTITPSASMLGSGVPVCNFTISATGASWSAQATAQDSTSSSSSYTGNWNNNGVSLTNTSIYHINYHCIGK